MHQLHQIAINEKLKLDTEIELLSNFIDAISEMIDVEEQKRLKAQIEVMLKYSEVLGTRIAAFDKWLSKRVKKQHVDNMYEVD